MLHTHTIKSENIHLIEHTHISGITHSLTPVHHHIDKKLQSIYPIRQFGVQCSRIFYESMSYFCEPVQQVNIQMKRKCKTIQNTSEISCCTEH